jgi:hypothetical protein
MNFNGQAVGLAWAMLVWTGLGGAGGVFSVVVVFLREKSEDRFFFMILV